MTGNRCKLEESCEYSGLRPSQANIFLPAATRSAWAPIMQHLPHNPSLDTRGEAEVRVTQDHLMSSCRRGARYFLIHLGDHSEAGPEQTPLLLSYIPASIMGMSERVSNVVVSLHVVPLILLKKDQVLNLNSQGISAFYVGDCSDQ